MTNKKWYDKWGWLLFWLFLFYPVGIYGLFRSGLVNKNLKIGVGVFFGILLAITLYPKSDEEIEQERLLEVRQKEITDSTRKANHIKDSTDKTNKLKLILSNTIKEIDKGLDFSSYRGSVENITLEIAVFKVWSEYVSDGLNSTDKETIELANRLKPKVSKIQLREFPILRKEFSKVYDEIQWENNMDVYTSGRGHRYIYFVHHIFASNKHIKTHQTDINNILYSLRFTQAHYLWHKRDDEHQFYTMKPKKDSELY